MEAEILFYGTDDLLNEGVCRSVLLCARRSRLFLISSFFTRQLCGLGFFGVSEHFRSQERLYIRHQTFRLYVIFYVLSNFSHLNNCLAVNYKPQVGTCEPQTKPRLTTAQHNTAAYSHGQQNCLPNGQTDSHTPSSQYHFLITLFLPATQRSRNPVREW